MGSPTQNTLLKTFENMVKNLCFPSESDYPIEVHLYDSAENLKTNPDLFLQKVRQTPDRSLQTLSVEALFAPVIEEQDWFGEEEKAIAQRFRHLLAFIQTHLQNVVVYQVGEVELNVYILGEFEPSKWLVLSTRVIET